MRTQIFVFAGEKRKRAEGEGGRRERERLTNEKCPSLAAKTGA